MMQEQHEQRIQHSESSDDSSTEGRLEDEQLNQFIEELCVSKAEEFHLLGYEYVTGEEIWECVSQNYEAQGIPLLHRIVNDILTLKVTRFMNWMTMKAYKLEDI